MSQSDSLIIGSEGGDPVSALNLGAYLNDKERSELEAMYALIVQTGKAYVRDANRRGVKPNHGGSQVENWFQDARDNEAKGWQSALSAMLHVFGEVRYVYETQSRTRPATS